jgi:alkanesulfonate monooxygenase SsuD/methylene tetrahydromethanopterin reductase-like flavin-dependent oxidoreductase (luciferase family)
VTSYGLGSLLSIDELMRCASQVGPDDSVWIPETWGMECMGVISAVSQRSACRRIGSSILNVYSRSPAALAMGAATLDTLSGGRFVLGLGASSPAIVGGLHGMEYEKPVRRVRECVEIIRMALGGGRIDYAGEVYNLRGFSLLVRPPRERVPVYLAAVNPKMMRLAWEVADGVILYLRPPGEIRDTLRAMGGRRIKVACQIITAVSRDARAAYDRARRTLAFYVSVGAVYREFLAAHGYAEQTSSIHSEYRRGGLEAARGAVPDAMLHSLTACGTPRECAAAIERFAAAGVNEPILQFNPVGDVSESFDLLRRVSD